MDVFGAAASIRLLSLTHTVSSFLLCAARPSKPIEKRNPSTHRPENEDGTGFNTVEGLSIIVGVDLLNSFLV